LFFGTSINYVMQLGISTYVILEMKVKEKHAFMCVCVCVPRCVGGHTILSHICLMLFMNVSCYSCVT
jgi:hypothetical protein